LNGKKNGKKLTFNVQKFGVQNSNLHKAKKGGEIPYLLKKQQNNTKKTTRVELIDI
jgi:hypothetical protein